MAWQLTMNPEDYLRLGAPTATATVVRLRPRGSGVLFDGCLVWAGPTYPNVVVCSPLVAPGLWDLPPEYYLNLIEDRISTDPPTAVLGRSSRCGPAAQDRLPT